MRDIWFVDSADAEAFHLFPDCPALAQAVQPILVERVSGLARVVRTERFGNLHPCARCRDTVDAEPGAAEWADRLESAAGGDTDPYFILMGEEQPSAAMLRGEEPLRVFKQSFSQLRVFTDRLEIKRLLAEPDVSFYTDIVELRSLSWIPILRAPAIEIDVDIDGEVFTDRFELDIRDPPDRILDAVDELILSANSRAAEVPARVAQAEARAVRSVPSKKRKAASAEAEAAPASPEAAEPSPASATAAETAKRKARGVQVREDAEREELARLYDEAQGLGGAIIDGGSGADLTKGPLTGDGFAGWVMGGCDDAESRKKLAELLEEAVRFARFMKEANENPLTNPKRWAKLVVTIAGCDAQDDTITGEGDAPGASGDGAGGGAAGGGGRGKPGRTPGPIGAGPDPIDAGPGEPQEDQVDDEEAKKARKWLRDNFRNIDPNKAIITAGRGKYNCMGHVLNVEGLVGDFATGAGSISRDVMDDLFRTEGWVDDENGKLIAIWGRDWEHITHVSKVLPSGRHESKFGFNGYQVIHDADELRGSQLYRDLKLLGTRRGTPGPPRKMSPPPNTWEN